MDGSGCPTWLQFLHDSTAGDNELIAFMQRMAGYSLTGDVREHALFFVYGTGGNGKGTFLNTLAWILGDYAKVASMETFTEAKNERHPQELASLTGRRLVTAQETEEGKRWAESRIKALTGGDPITARFMRQDEFTFMPQFKLIIAGNHKPGLRNVDEAIKRRLHLIPFTVTIPPEKRDPLLAEKLRAEAAGILAWCVQGCLEWQRIGLAAPDAVKVATEEYLSANDVFQQWVEECCKVQRGLSATPSALHKSYKAWAEDRDEYVMAQTKFSQLLDSRGFHQLKSNGTRRVMGITLLSISN
jgi:putative DNA primase/helicase